MIRALICALIASLYGAAALASECVIFPEERGDTIAEYAHNANVCLQDTPKRFDFDEAVELDVLERINEERAARGLNRLTLRPEMRDAARIHSLDMAMDDFLAHKGPDGRDVSARVAALDRRLIRSEIRENVAFIKGDQDWPRAGEILHTNLMNSEGHRANILAPGITHIAIGVVRTKKAAWITEVFVHQEGYFEQPLPIRLSQGEGFPNAVWLDDWQTAGVYAGGGSEAIELPGGRLPLSFADYGDIDLRVRGERILPDRSGKEIIYLPGPGLTIE